jgi:hypothetical protein
MTVEGQHSACAGTTAMISQRKQIVKIADTAIKEQQGHMKTIEALAKEAKFIKARTCSCIGVAF